MEILAPAGSPEGLAAAIKGGCDAVYLGGKSFGARAFADNFSDPELEGAVAYAHGRGAKVYVTVNTLVKNSELDEAVSYVQFLKDIGADAVLIQDLGLLDAVKRIPIAKHASTQMGVHSRRGLEWCAEHGISRAVLARELTFEEIEDIARDAPIETEVFVQGAMCYSMSGGCLFSSIVGGRSGNRGECAQPCRKRYSSGAREGYLLSNSDLFCIDCLGRLRDAGVTSVKIEGRMRSTAYAYLASRAYSLAERDPGSPELPRTVELLKTVFNRGFCHGYLDGAGGLVHSSYPDNRGMLLGRVDVAGGRFSVAGTGAGQGDGVSLFSGDAKAGGFKIQGAGPAVRAPFPIADGAYDLYRTYDPRLDEVKNLIGPRPKLTGRTARCPAHACLPRLDRPPAVPKLSFYVSSVKMLEAVLPYADRIYYDGADFGRAAAACRGKEAVCVLPRLTPSERMPEGGAPVMVHGVGQLKAAEGRRVYGSYSMNMFNSAFPDAMYQTTMSVELTKGEVRDLAARYPGRLEAMVFGRTELMVTRDPEIEPGSIRDEKGYEFPVYRDRAGCARILNSSDLMLFDFLRDLERWGVNSFGVDLRKRPAELGALVARAFGERDASEMERIRRMCGGTFNTGHMLRGV